jgi:hypothetical protein
MADVTQRDVTSGSHIVVFLSPLLSFSFLLILFASLSCFRLVLFLSLSLLFLGTANDSWQKNENKAISAILQM